MWVNEVAPELLAMFRATCHLRGAEWGCQHLPQTPDKVGWIMDFYEASGASEDNPDVERVFRAMVQLVGANELGPDDLIPLLNKCADDLYEIGAIPRPVKATYRTLHTGNIVISWKSS